MAHQFYLIIVKRLQVQTLVHEAVVFYSWVPKGSPSLGGDVVVCVEDINQPSVPTPFYSVLVSVSVVVVLSTVFHSINSPDNSQFYLSTLPVLSLCPSSLISLPY